jgi:hypothetical protein
MWSHITNNMGLFIWGLEHKDVWARWKLSILVLLHKGNIKESPRKDLVLVMGQSHLTLQVVFPIRRMWGNLISWRNIMWKTLPFFPIATLFYWSCLFGEILLIFFWNFVSFFVSRFLGYFCWKFLLVTNLAIPFLQVYVLIF